MTSKEYEYIIVLAKKKSITKAAEKLYITQPALSLFLTRLESDIGFPLFTRNREGLELTFVGKKYVEMARKILELDRGFQQDLCEIDKHHMGSIHVGTSAHIGSYILPAVITEFNKIYPNIDVEIYEANSTILEGMIDEKRLDIALMHLPLRNINASYESIFKDRYVMAFHNENPLKDKIYYKNGEKYPYIDPREAKGQKFVLAFPYQRVRQISDRILAHAGIIPNIRLISSSVQTALRFASMNLGITFVPESYLDLFQYSQDLQLCYMEEEYEAYWVFSLVYPDKDSNSIPIKEFTRITKSLFSK